MRTQTRVNVETWRCDACGAYTDEPLQECSECQAKRLDGPAESRLKKARRGGKQAVKPLKTVRARKKGTKNVKPPKSEEPPQGPVEEVPILIEDDPDLTTAARPDSVLTEISERMDISPNSTVNDNANGDIVAQTVSEAQVDEPQLGLPDEFPSTNSPSDSTSSEAIEGSFGLVYVNTPVPELIKRKFDLDFETFPSISIGRSPENVVVIPDSGVSRTHAELKRDGTRLLLTDLQSSNGTFVYDGKEFQKVDDTIELRPNTLVKLGTGTILRLVSE